MCFTLSHASPVYFPEEVSDDFFAVVPAGGSLDVVHKENADKDKLGEKALVPADEKGAFGPGLVVSNEDDSSEENSTEPVKKLLIRTFTDLHPKVALELINKTISIENATDIDEVTTKKADRGKFPKQFVNFYN